MSHMINDEAHSPKLELPVFGANRVFNRLPQRLGSSAPFLKMIADTAYTPPPLQPVLRVERAAITIYHQHGNDGR